MKMYLQSTLLSESVGKGTKFYLAKYSNGLDNFVVRFNIADGTTNMEIPTIIEDITKFKNPYPIPE